MNWTTTIDRALREHAWQIIPGGRDLGSDRAAFGAPKVAKPSLEPNAALMSLFAHA